MVCRVNAGCPEPFRDCNDWLMMNVYYLINTWGTNLKCVINGDTNYYYIHISDKFQIILHCVIYFEKSFRIWKQVSVLSSANFNLCHYYFLSHTQLHFHILTLPEDTLSLFFSFIKSSWLHSQLYLLLAYFWCWMVMVVLLQSSYFSLLKSFF